METKQEIKPRVIPLVQAISETLHRVEGLEATANGGYIDGAYESLDELESLLPSGSGLNSGTKIQRPGDLLESKPHRIVLEFGYHHADEHGSYCGWTHWIAKVRPTFGSIAIEMELVSDGADHERCDEATGETYDAKDSVLEITKENLSDLFYYHLQQPVECHWDDDRRRVVYRIPSATPC